MRIEPIQTAYKGYRFRSRLEARWAVFFDAAGLTWEYEPEGFELPGGLRYLPDFRISSKTRRIWVEVKPEEPDVLERRKLQWLLNPNDSADYGLFLIGAPDDQRGIGIVYSQSFGFDRMRTIREDDPRLWLDWLGSEEHISSRTETWARAVAAARGARFEHGESGASA